MATAYDTWLEPQDRFDADRTEWIADRYSDLLADYKADPKMRDKAVEEFMGCHDTVDLENALRLFMAAYENATATGSVCEAANDFAKSLRGYIDPILSEWAEDKAIEEWNLMEASAIECREEQRSAA